MTLRHVASLGLLAGIGFTVSLFITELAFDDPGLVAEAKVGILVASLAAAIGGVALLRSSHEGSPRPRRRGNHRGTARQ